MKKLFVLAAFLGFAMSANAQCSGAKTAATTAATPTKACCGGKKVCSKTADATGTASTAVAVGAEVDAAAAPKKACTGEGKKCCAKKTAEAVAEPAKGVNGTN